MKKIMEIISYLALALLVAAPILFYAEKITLQMNKTLMLIATVVWFAIALCWMGRKGES
jgi:hypothetical protein